MKIKEITNDRTYQEIPITFLKYGDAFKYQNEIDNNNQTYNLRFFIKAIPINQYKDYLNDREKKKDFALTSYHEKPEKTSLVGTKFIDKSTKVYKLIDTNNPKNDILSTS